MTQYRKEVDLLGEREVPADAYWGIHTLRAVENFNISNVTISDVPEFVRGMVMVKKAAGAHFLRRVGVKSLERLAHDYQFGIAFKFAAEQKLLEHSAGKGRDFFVDLNADSRLVN